MSSTFIVHCLSLLPHAIWIQVSEGDQEPEDRTRLIAVSRNKINYMKIHQYLTSSMSSSWCSVAAIPKDHVLIITIVGVTLSIAFEAM